jgi:hypothetical protein
MVGGAAFTFGNHFTQKGNRPTPYNGHKGGQGFDRPKPTLMKSWRVYCLFGLSREEIALIEDAL